jgi:hypothetical protein
MVAAVSDSEKVKIRTTELGLCEVDGSREKRGQLISRTGDLGVRGLKEAQLAGQSNIETALCRARVSLLSTTPAQVACRDSFPRMDRAGARGPVKRTNRRPHSRDLTPPFQALRAPMGLKRGTTLAICQNALQRRLQLADRVSTTDNPPYKNMCNCRPTSLQSLPAHIRSSQRLLHVQEALADRPGRERERKKARVAVATDAGLMRPRRG